MQRTFIRSALCALIFLTTPVFAGDLVVEITGIRSADGRIYAGIHQPTPGVKFPDEAGSRYAFNLPARVGNIQVVFKDLPPGDYALTAYHDENDNGEIDRNALGIPTEGYAFSNDAMGFMGPPSFKDAAVTLVADEASATASGAIKY